MTYYADFSKYVHFSHQEKGSNVQNIGWLDKRKSFPKGVVDAKVIKKLEAFTKYSVHQTRGFHYCTICKSDDIIQYPMGDDNLLLGSAEIRIFGDNDVSYASPNMLLHYVTAHNYLPPKEFLAALLSSPVPPSKEYIAKAQSYSLIVDTTIIVEEE
ncbi:MAG: DUF7919 family protein [bacterium]